MEWNPFFVWISAPIRAQENELSSPVFNLLRHGQKGLLYICGILRRCFEEWDGELVSGLLNN